ncbi:MAG: histone family protein nucleoid-structuring protein [Polaromonas sp.]|nr:histone family protein nucleoid-structuring protein [Polaromonas sp.]
MQSTLLAVVFAAAGHSPAAQYDRRHLNFSQNHSMNDLIKLRQQIAEMEKQAAQLQRKNRPAVLAQLREQMAAYGITADELSRAPAKPARPKAAPTKAAGPAKGKRPAVRSPAKYRGTNGQEWSGKGITPKWLKDLLVDGKTMDDFLIGN